MDTPDHASRHPAGTPQLRTLLLTDLCESTSLVERLGDTPASELFREHDRLVLKLQQQWRGRLIDRSDGLLLLFERPIDGLGFALDYNRGLADIGIARKLKLHARAGLHVGEVLTWRNSDEAVRVGAKPLEVEGLAKPMAARLMTMARPGQILLSAVAEPLAHRAARELGERGQQLLWKSHGRWRFKGVPSVQEVYEVGEPGVAPLRAPPNTPKAWRDLPLWRRPAALAAEVALAIGIGIAVWFVTKPQPAIAFGERDWVVVGDLRNLTGQSVLDESLAQAFRISLEQSRHVNVLSDLKARDTLARMQRKPGTPLDRAIASEIALRDGARAVILPTVAEVGGRVRVSIEVIDPHTQATVYAESADGTGVGSVLDSIDTVTAALRGKLGEAVKSIERDSAPLPQVTTENLDALRAYALGQEATSNRQWEQAIGFYQRAVDLDPKFALAYTGLVRLHWSSINYADALPHLSKALALRESLPPRDRLYLDAWKAETAPTGSPLEAWRLLASMYPDYFAGSSNTSWYLLAANRYKEALPYAEAAAVPQSPLRAFPLDHIGRIQLALGNASAALKTFRQAELASAGAPIRYRADALAVLGRYPEAWSVVNAIRVVPGDPSSNYVSLERISLALDQGRFDLANSNARLAVEAAAGYGNAQHEHFQVVLQSVNLVRDPSSISLAELKRLAQASQEQLAKADAPDRQSHAFRMLTLAYLAQRIGNVAFAAEIMGEVAPLMSVLDSANLDKMLAIVRATQVRLMGDPQQAAILLAKEIDGQELVQARVALLASYADAGRHQDAETQANWLIANRGRAYVEINMDQLLQPLNVADTRLARLWASRSLASRGSQEAATRERLAFVRAWPYADLPDYLRRKLDVTFPDSKQKMTVNAAVDVK